MSHSSVNEINICRNIMSGNTFVYNSDGSPVDEQSKENTFELSNFIIIMRAFRNKMPEKEIMDLLNCHLIINSLIIIMITKFPLD